MLPYIDVHHHIMPDFYVEAVGVPAITDQAPRFARAALNWTIEHSLAEMGANHVAAALLSLSAPGLRVDSPKAAAALARRCNDHMAELVRRHPDQLGFFATLPLPDVPASLAEIQHALDTLNTDGIGLFSCYGNRYLGDPAFDPVFAALNDHGATVFVHPNVSDICRQLMPDYPVSILEFPLDTTRTVLSLLYSGVFSRYPNVRFIFSHAGGATPFLAHRLRRLENQEEFLDRVPGGAMPWLQRQFYDTALSANPPALAALQAFVPSSQILYGSDFPFAVGMMPKTIAGLDAHPMPPPDRQAIAHENALSLFPRFSTAL
ncbi:MAG: amidohydrolase family protein [Pigmentiphaga sp.]